MLSGLNTSQLGAARNPCERLLRNVEVGRKTHMSPIVDGFNGAALATVGTTAPLPRWGI